MRHRAPPKPGKRFSAAPPLPEPHKPIRVLVVDDDETICQLIARSLAQWGDMAVETSTDSRELALRIATQSPDVVLLDIMMPEPERPRASCASQGRAGHGAGHHDDRARRAWTWSSRRSSLAPTSSSSSRSSRWRRSTSPSRRPPSTATSSSDASLETRLEAQERFGELVGDRPPCGALQDDRGRRRRDVDRADPRRERDRQGARRARDPPALAARDAPFVAVNCGAIPQELVESELFGHVRGAFTGAQTRRARASSRPPTAARIFLDEVGDLPLAAQVKLLRALQEGEVKRVGADETRAVDVRVVAATNVDLEAPHRRRAGSGRTSTTASTSSRSRLPPLRERRGRTFRSLA